MTIIAFYVPPSIAPKGVFDLSRHSDDLAVYTSGDSAIDRGDWAGLQAVSNVIKAELFTAVAPTLDIGVYSDIDHAVLLRLISEFQIFTGKFAKNGDSFYALILHEWDENGVISYVSGDIDIVESYFHINSGWESFCINMSTGAIGKRYYDPLLFRVTLGA